MTRFSLQDPDLFRRQAYVGRQWCDADNGATLDINNPATGEILGTVPLMGTAETRRATAGSHYGIEEFMEVKYLCLGGA
jgi:succinate-semialdehyde dehydrogenase / glutarate-semialdehyde dehydrogenase